MSTGKKEGVRKEGRMGCTDCRLYFKVLGEPKVEVTVILREVPENGMRVRWEAVEMRKIGKGGTIVLEWGCSKSKARCGNGDHPSARAELFADRNDQGAKPWVRYGRENSWKGKRGSGGHYGRNGGGY